ncbi:Nn.00g097150.m01.CDS01 [Neocucurbitaria sp. VM-36]
MSNFSGSDDGFPPSPPLRTQSAPATLYGPAATSPPPSPPPPLPRTINNQGEPDVNLSAPDDDIKDPLAFRSMEEIAQKLMSPPARSWAPTDHTGRVLHDRVCIRLDWVKSAVSEKHFIFDPAKRRSVLRNDSKIRTHGLAYGLPRRYWEWLCGRDVSNVPYKVTKEMLWISRVDFRRVAFPSS